MKESRRGLFTTSVRALVGRRRTVPRAEETSDVVRFRGVLWATGLGAVAALGVILAEPLETQRAPGALAHPHREAGLACAACHGPQQPVARSCAGCHGPHPSTRAGHRALAERGQLGCSDCHRVHRDFGGVVFRPEGQVLRFEAGRSVEVQDAPGPSRAAGVVPVVPAAACGTCHESTRSDDPIARCLVRGQDELGGRRPTVCFDEHRALVQRDLADPGSARRRLDLWEAAREVVTRHPRVAPPSPPRFGALGWLAACLGMAGLGWAGSLGIRRARLRARETRSRSPAPIDPPKVRRLPRVDTSTCIGCSGCVDACPYDVLELQRYVAMVVRPDDCCGLTLCEQRCPNGSLVVSEGERIEDRPRTGDDLQSLDVAGVYLAGDLTGLPLIRNAINQGAYAARQAAASLDGRGDGERLDLVVVGAGPAGLSASLQATCDGLRHVVLEQGSVAESIRSFPRGKLVFDQPLGVPLVGDLWLQESTKEELLGHWLRIVRRHRLPIAEGHRMTELTRMPDGTLQVTAMHDGRLLRFATRRVVVAVGRRGSPRKLSVEIPDALAHRVHYSLADARTFAGRKLVVVGLGDVAMETAIALARQPGTQVTIAYRGERFRRGKRRNISEIQRLVAAGRIDLRWRTEVLAFADSRLHLRSPDGPQALPWDAAFVMIGAIAPWAFLERLGLRRMRNSGATSLGPVAGQSPPEP